MKDGWRKKIPGTILLVVVGIIIALAGSIANSQPRNLYPETANAPIID